MSLRSQERFTRYAFAIQYHGGGFLGISQQKMEYDCETQQNISSFVHSVEFVIRSAFTTLIGEGNFENMQVSSRTDRGVHALYNTFHVDVRPRSMKDLMWDAKKLQLGTNFYLRRSPYFIKNSIPVHVMAVGRPPDLIPNPFYVQGSGEPKETNWNARFTAFERTYCYQIVNSVHINDCFAPFDYDRAWRVQKNKKTSIPLNIDDMKLAATYLMGTHDFTSFRGIHCQRTSPITTIQDIQVIESDHYLNSLFCTPFDASPVRKITIKVTGNAFLYRQVRNIVGCLVDVGYGRITPENVKNILLEKNRMIAPDMAPPQGLYLVDVKHKHFKFPLN